MAFIGGCCLTCDECYLVPLSCITDGVNLLHKNLSDTALRGVLLKAQTDYVEGLLGGCFEDLCTKLANSYLDPSDAGYAPLSEEYQTLIRRYIQPLLVTASSFIWISLKGWKELTHISKEQEERDRLYKAYQGAVHSCVNRLEKYLKENYETLKCGCPPDPCKKEEVEDVYIGGDWEGVSSYPLRSVNDVGRDAGYIRQHYEYSDCGCECDCNQCDGGCK
ncbi:MAG: hypothetical protein AAFO96_03780 [Bacteroidota bacterium]